MVEPLHPEELEELLAGYVLGNLNSDEAERVRRLLVTRPELEGTIQQLREVLEVIPYSLPMAEPSAQVRSAVLAGAIAHSPREQHGKRQPFLVWGTVAAATLLAIGLDNFSLRRQLTHSHAQLTSQQDLLRMLQSSQTQLISLKGMARMETASGSAVLNPSHSEAILVLQNLPNLPPGQFYCLWTLINDQKIETGEFRPNAQGQVFLKVPLSAAHRISGFAVTIEAEPSPTAPAGPLVMISSR